MYDSDIWSKLESELESVTLTNKPLKKLSNLNPSLTPLKKSTLALDTLMENIKSESTNSLNDYYDRDSPIGSTYIMNTKENNEKSGKSVEFGGGCEKNSRESFKRDPNANVVTKKSISRMEELVVKLDEAAKLKKQRPVSIFFEKKKKTPSGK